MSLFDFSDAKLQTIDVFPLRVAPELVGVCPSRCAKPVISPGVMDTAC